MGVSEGTLDWPSSSNARSFLRGCLARSGLPYRAHHTAVSQGACLPTSLCLLPLSYYSSFYQVRTRSDQYTRQHNRLLQASFTRFLSSAPIVPHTMVNPFKNRSSSSADPRSIGPSGTYCKKRLGKTRQHLTPENSPPKLPKNTSYEPAKLAHLVPCSQCHAFVGHLEDCIEHLCAVCNKPRNGFHHQFRGCPVEAPLDIYEARWNSMPPFEIPDEPVFPGMAVFERLRSRVPLVIGRYPTVQCPPPLSNFFRERFARNSNVAVLRRCDDMVLRIGLLHLRCLLDRSLRDRRQLLADTKRLRNHLDVTLSPRSNRDDPVLALSCDKYWDVRGIYREWELDHVLKDFAQKDVKTMSREELKDFLTRGAFVRDDIDKGNFEIQNYIAPLNFYWKGTFRSMSPDVTEGYGKTGRETKQILKCHQPRHQATG